MCLFYSVIADVEGVLDDEADYLRRELGEMRGERCGEGVEVVALVLSEAARRDHFLDVRIYVRVGRVRGERGAGAEEDRDEASVTGVGTYTCTFQGRLSMAGPRVDLGAVFDEHPCRLDVRIYSRTRPVKRRSVNCIAPVHVRPSFDQGGDDFSVAAPGSEVERCPLMRVQHINIRSRFEEHM